MLFSVSPALGALGVLGIVLVIGLVAFVLVRTTRTDVTCATCDTPLDAGACPDCDVADHEVVTDEDGNDFTVAH